MPQHKIQLDESQLPQAWYNINADLPVPPQPVLLQDHEYPTELHLPQVAIA